MAYDKLPALLRGLSFEERLAFLVRFVRAHERMRGTGRHGKQPVLLGPYKADLGRQKYKRPVMDDPLADAAARGKSISTSDEIHYTDEERVFLDAVAQYKTKYERPNPTCCEMLAVLKSLGYRKDADNGK